MTSLLLAASLATAARSDDARLGAVRSVVGFARQIEAVCEPRFLTTPPQPIASAVSFQPSAAYATRLPDGGFVVDYEAFSGVARTWEIQATFRRAPSVPEGAKKRDRKECVAIARKIAAVVVPASFELGDSYAVRPEDEGGTILTDVVLKEDPRLRVGRVDLVVDPYTGLPKQVSKRLRWPEVDAGRIRNVLPVEVLHAEALRVQRSLPALGAAHLARCHYLYQVPDFRSCLNEMTSAHEVNVQNAQAIPIYQWLLVGRDEGRERNRVIWIDARTGRGLATQDYEYAYLGDKDARPPLGDVTSGVWRLGKATGSLAKVAAESFDGVPVVLANAAGEVRTLRFDAKLGLVSDEAGAYRPDATLLRAMRAQKAERAFGRK